MDFGPLFILVLLLSFGLSQANASWNQPAINIFNRWVRWILVSAIFAQIVTMVTEPDSRPFWLLFIIGALIYFLLETVYNWIAVNALSRSDFKLFPTYKDNTSGDEWPAHKRFFKTREWLRNNGFNREQSIKAQIIDGFDVRSSIYIDKDKRTRLQILFFPQRMGSLTMNFVLISKTKDDRRIITDNIYMPYGGFYPEDWELTRNPFVRELSGLVSKHNKRTAKLDLEEWDEVPLTDLNAQQRTLEDVNLQEGFLLPYNHHEEYGRLSSEGRYRLWKEMWLLNYFGISI